MLLAADTLPEVSIALTKISVRPTDSGNDPLYLSLLTSSVSAVTGWARTNS